VVTLIIEMMRVCPKCGDYYADASLAFCLSDGAPLISVSPTSERWSEGARVIEEKAKALKKEKRKLKWRRMIVSMMAIATLVVMVVAINSFIYVESSREENVVALPSTPETAPAEPVGPITPSTTGATSPTLPTNSTPTVTPTPTPVYKISGRVTDGSKALGSINITLGGAKTATTTTDANGNYTFKQLPAGGNYTITAASAKIVFKPPSRSIKNLTRDESANFVGAEQPAQPGCSVADNSTEEKAISDKYRKEWQRVIKGVQPKIIAEKMPAGARPRPAGVPSPQSRLGTIEFKISFPKACTATVTASVNLIGTMEVVPVRKFLCKKTSETWRCS
jgi:hypothetical protein